MDTPLRNLLLMEADGFDCTYQAQGLAQELHDSPLYKVTLERLEKAANESGLDTVNRVYVECRDMSFAIESVAEYAKLESRILNLGIKALPRWWLNPLNPIETSERLTSIGQLFATDDGAYTIDQVITDETMADLTKADILSSRVDFWHKSMKEKVERTLSEFRENKQFARYGGNGLSFYLRIVLLVLANVFVFLTLMIPSNDIIEAFYHPRLDLLETYVVYIPLVSTALYDLVYLVYTLITLRRNQGTDYAYKFASLRSRRYLEHLDAAAKELLKDILDHAATRQPFMSGSLYKHATKIGQELDLDALTEERKKREKHPLSWLRALYLFACFLCLFSIIFAIIALIILGQGGLFA